MGRMVKTPGKTKHGDNANARYRKREKVATVGQSQNGNYSHKRVSDDNTTRQ